MQMNLLGSQGFFCCLAFFFAGIIDSISGGGGLITIPVMLAVGIPVHFITGTNQCSVWIGTGLAAYEYIKNKEVHLKSALVTLPFAVLGSYIGARCNLLVPETYLKTFMVIMIPLIAVFMFTNKHLGDIDEADQQPVNKVILSSGLIGFVLGMYQGFYGPGAGLFFMLAYAALVKLSLVRATGNTRFVIAVASTSSVLTYAASGTVIWNLAIAATVVNMIGSYIGAKLAIKNGSRIIRPIMFGVVTVLFIKIILEMLP